MKHKCGDTIIIIGAGIAGLAAGCYAQMNGYRTQIFELHEHPLSLARIPLSGSHGCCFGRAWRACDHLS